MDAEQARWQEEARVAAAQAMQERAAAARAARAAAEIAPPPRASVATDSLKALLGIGAPSVDFASVTPRECPRLHELGQLPPSPDWEDELARARAEASTLSAALEAARTELASFKATASATELSLRSQLAAAVRERDQLRSQRASVAVPPALQGGDGRGAQCKCHSRVRMGNGMCGVAYPPRRGGGGEPHTERLSELGGKRSLLGSLRQFCRAFYHARQWEAGVELLCLLCSEEELVGMEARGREGGDGPKAAAGGAEGGEVPECGKVQVAIVARLALRGERDYIARYANCFRGRSEDNVHAEEFVLQDAQLDALLRSGRATELSLYMSYQPCHHSGGRLPESSSRQLAVASARANQGHPTSCSEKLAAFAEQVLRPHLPLPTVTYRCRGGAPP